MKDESQCSKDDLCNACVKTSDVMFTSFYFFVTTTSGYKADTTTFFSVLNAPNKKFLIGFSDCASEKKENNWGPWGYNMLYSGLPYNV